MAKKRGKKKKRSGFLVYVAWTLAIIALALSALIVGYYIGFHKAQEQSQRKVQQAKQKTEQLLQKLEKSTKVDVKKRLKEVLKKESKNYTSAIHETDGDKTLVNPPKIVPKKLHVNSKKPKLAIIIDDVSTASQVRAIKAVHIPLTMSFLPPSPARPNSYKLAAKESFYMVHLPMEAMHFSKEEPHTLHIKDSQQAILKRIAQIKKLFPKVHYINNHTGSKFTSNEIAMNRLIFALKQNNIKFIDSRTTAQTQAPKVLKNYSMRYVARDIFLDHHQEKGYVKEQIKKAVAYAKSHGSAIAIGHPHPNTLQALMESKKILSQVELVKVNRIY
ncbi:MAG: divergent polysaccharide deacetylase family protein [Epsilonproteobacteria bacterium]|nr:divergent polysaccharide deacetylase family protein [Campylobacterota bacterium]